MRFRFVLALMVAGLLSAAGIASAQQTTTQPLSDYQATTPAATTPKPAQGQGDVAPMAAGKSTVTPSVAAQPAGSAPSRLAFTGAEPLVLVALGLALAGGTATLLLRDRRRPTRD